MKSAVIFGIVVLIGFILIYMLFNKGNPTEDTQGISNFLTPTPSPTVVLNSPTPVPTVAESDRISANTATIKTVKGDIEVELYATDAAKTVMNFATLSKRGYYDNLTFHRVESWVIQGGDPNGDGTGGVSIYGSTFEDEINPSSPLYQNGYVPGTLAMANRGPNTNGSQFFIMKNQVALQPAYTIFGKVTSGMNVVQSIVPGDKILKIEVRQ
jgi:cyclophilin family peptidyl-prolyl cis-trans isomerase